MIKTDLGEIIYSLSRALDISATGISYHHHSVALISSAIANKLCLPTKERDLLFLSALVHDAGVITNHELSDLITFEDINPFEHCRRGYDIFCRSNYMKEISQILLHHHDRWQGMRIPGIFEDMLQTCSNIIYLSDRVAVLLESSDGYVLYKAEEIIDKIVKNRGLSFNPKVVDAFIEASKPESFWLDLQPQIVSDVVNMRKPKMPIDITLDELLSIAIAYSKIIDNKSAYTYNHSNSVALAAEFLACKLGFTEYEKTMIKIAGYLHDLGKLSIPNEILDKPSRLTKEEFLVIKRHTYYSYFLVKDIPGFELIASWGPFHHEKLDGTGYPFRLKGSELSLGARIMTVSDMFAALTENRPYRKSLSKEECLQILYSSSARGHIDESIVRLVEQYYDELLSLTSRKLN